MLNFVRDYPMIFHVQFGFNQICSLSENVSRWPSLISDKQMKNTLFRDECHNCKKDSYQVTIPSNISFLRKQFEYGQANGHKLVTIFDMTF